MFGRHHDILKKYQQLAKGSEILPSIFSDVQKLHDEIENVEYSQPVKKPIDVSALVANYDESGLMYNDVVELCLILMLTREVEEEHQKGLAARTAKAIGGERG